MSREISVHLAFLAALALAVSAACAGDEIVTIHGAGGATLQGTLTLPDGKAGAKFPAVVILAGSGPTDRNGNQPPALVTDLLRQIADGLAKNGIASLRYDKRGMHANRAEMPKDLAKFGEFFCWENFTGDAVAAFKFLQARAEIDPARVGITGHSEGGLLALCAASDLKSTFHGPAILVLLSTPGRPIDAVIEGQLQTLLKKQQATPEQTKFFLDANARISKTIRETGKIPPDVPPGLAALYPQYLSQFYHSELAVDPAKLAGQFTGPVLIVAGGKDTQVSATLDAKPLDAALTARVGDDHRLVVVDDASHNLKPVNGDDPGFTGDIAPQALEAITSWCATKLAPKH